MSTELKVSSHLHGFARRLVSEGLMEEAAALNAVEQAAKSGSTILAWLIGENLIEPELLAFVASVEYGVPLIDVGAMDLTVVPLSLVDERLIQKHRALPLYLRGNSLFIGLSDPTDHEIIDEISFSSGFHVEPILVASNLLAAAIERALESAETEFNDFEEEGIEDLGFQLESDNASEEDTSDPAVDETPVVRFVNKVLLDAIRKGASDIHFEPYEKSYRIRYRLDGVLKGVASPPVLMARRLSSRLKVMAGLDIAEKRVPQDGRIKLNISRNKSIDFRVSTCPILFGEKVVLRILDSASTRLGIEGLGFETAQQEAYHEAVKKPYGMILVTGPTGSGKTVTLYTALQNAKQGMTFARALRSFLRQDPDVIMVGEIRDLETAEIAVKAAQTGHLVLSTLHTNDAPQSITRLMNMGVPSYNITSAVNLVMAQRLIRKLHICKVADDLPKEALHLKIYKPNGCHDCNEGYRGRTGIFEVMPITDAIARIILRNGDSMEIAAQARLEKCNDLRRSALNKVAEGLTDLIEINRVTKD
jgi:type IV pilus assembly protein PilB